jgi:maleylacetoacetate isomerase
MSASDSVSDRELQLYHYWRSSCSWRVRWALEIKGIPYRPIPINLLKDEQKSPAYLQINPSGTVPCLTAKGRNLTDSLAILEWLDEVYPQEKLLPADPWKRAEVRAFSMQIAAGIQPLANLRVIHRYSDDPQKRKEWIQHFITAGFHPVERHLEKNGRTFCFGDTLTMADLFLIPQVYNALRFDVNMAAFPLARRIYETCLQLGSCDRAAPHNQEGATP